MKSQADCYRALLDGKTLVNGTVIVKLESGKQVTNKKNESFSFRYPEQWKIKEEPKKLYAYRDNDSEIRFFSTGKGDETYTGFERLPEYDLEYPNE